MTEPATPPASSEPTAPAAAPAPTNAQLMFSEPPAATPEPGKEPPKEGAEPPKDGQEGKEGQDKPVEYTEFNVPQDMPAPPEVMGQFKEIAAKHKLPQEAAQALLDLHVKMNLESMKEWEDTKTEWRGQLEQDTTYGGKNLQATIVNANKIVQQYGDKELIEDLHLLGLGNKLSFARFLNKIHAAVRDDSSDASGGAGEVKLSPEKVLYPNMN